MNEEKPGAPRWVFWAGIAGLALVVIFAEVILEWLLPMR